MEPEDDKPVGERYEIPRQSFWATVPKRSFVRVVVLLVALLGILYLRQQTSSIAGCMSNAFRALPSTSIEARNTAAHVRIEVRVDASSSR
jgi:hypothetical protein